MTPDDFIERHRNLAGKFLTLRKPVWIAPLRMLDRCFAAATICIFIRLPGRADLPLILLPGTAIKKLWRKSGNISEAATSCKTGWRLIGVIPTMSGTASAGRRP